MSNPRKIARKDTQGRFLKKSYAYHDNELWVIEEALKKIPHIIG
ncbi:hypothetical protein NIES2107_71870 (plasmid) [Nostoc carneum NIES-2107]|nr:hypothetical protein NIES2107_71870 [Nostoc carneum NIES-2107]